MSTFARVKTTEVERIAKLALARGIEHVVLEELGEWATFSFTTPRSRRAFENLCAENNVIVDGSQVIDQMLDAVIDRAASPKQVIEAFVTHKMTKGIANALGKMASKNTKYVCGDCGYAVPKYSGRYPTSCPQCGGALAAPQETEASYPMSASDWGKSPAERQRNLGTFPQWLKTVTRLLNAKGRGTAAEVYKKFLKTQWEDGVLPQVAAEELIGKE